MEISCPRCGTMNTVREAAPSGVRYRCARCHAALPVGSGLPKSNHELQALRSRVQAVERRVSALERHVLAAGGETPTVEEEAAPAATVEAQPGAPVAEARPEREAVPEMQAGEMKVDAGVARVAAAVRAPSQARSGPGSPGTAAALAKWEQALPGNWLSRIGVVALFIGLGFLAKLAYDNDWIHPVLQLLLGLLFGGVLLWAGRHWSSRYRVWAQALTGGGVGVLYLSLFASYALNDLMGFFPTFALMFLVTAGAAVIALRQESMAIAIIGIVGAFLVPVILGASDYSASGGAARGGHPALLMSYILVLDVGILWLATFRNWRWFILLGYLGSLAVYGMWHVTSGAGVSTLTALGGLTTIFIFFVGATTLFHMVWRRVPEPTDLALMSLNAAVYFGITYHLLWSDYRGWLGLVSLLLAGLYGLLGYAALRVSPENRRLSLFASGIAIVFLTVAIPAQLHRGWITVAWAAEGAVLFWLASRENIRQLQVWGLGIFGLVLIRLFAFDTFVDQASFRPVIEDSMFLPFALSVVSLYAAAYFVKQDRKALEPWLHPLMVLVASLLTVWMLSAEIVYFAGGRIHAAQIDHATASRISSLENARNLGLVGLWAAYGLGMVMVGLWRRWTWLRIPGYALMVIAAGATLVLMNYGHAGIDRETSTPIVNYGFGAFALCAAAFYACAYVVARNRDRLDYADRDLFPALVVAASFFSLWAFSSEIHIFVGSGDSRDNSSTLGLVLLWAAYGLGLLMVGVWRGWSWLRAGGYLLVAIAAGATLVVLNYGSASIGRADSTPILNYSFGAFAASAAAFYISAFVVAGSWERLYQEERALFPALVVGANALTLWALSSEILTFVGTGPGRNMGLTMLWATYGFALIAVGIGGRWRWVRIGGLALVSVAIVKLFLFDTFTLESGYRVAAYLTLGALLLAGGFAYHRYADVIKGLIFDEGRREGNANRG